VGQQYARAAGRREWPRCERQQSTRHRRSTPGTGCPSGGRRRPRAGQHRRRMLERADAIPSCRQTSTTSATSSMLAAGPS
jgi:hypothetical protein